MMIETERLILRDYAYDDLEYLYKLKACDAVWQYSTFIPFTNIVQAKEILNSILNNKNIDHVGFKALFLKKNNIFIGEVGIISAHSKVNRCEIGYNLLPDYWGYGYATEIVAELVKYAFEAENYERLEALVLEMNHASCRVLEKSGFVKEGILRNYNKSEAGYRNVNYYGIITEDYKKH
jgi:ribosomal-protein-alanine N-acetyltransferase